MPLKVQEKLREMSMQKKLIEEKRREIEEKLKKSKISNNEVKGKIQNIAPYSRFNYLNHVFKASDDTVGRIETIKTDFTGKM